MTSKKPAARDPVFPKFKPAQIWNQIVSKCCTQTVQLFSLVSKGYLPVISQTGAQLLQKFEIDLAAFGGIAFGVQRTASCTGGSLLTSLQLNVPNCAWWQALSSASLAVGHNSLAASLPWRRDRRRCVSGASRTPWPWNSRPARYISKGPRQGIV